MLLRLAVKISSKCVQRTQETPVARSSFKNYIMVTIYRPIYRLPYTGVRGFIIRWICSFLYGRRQAVKIKNIVSPWLPVHAGVPQGTKLGPILFLLMINDLATETLLLSRHWKYVDDLTISEVIQSGGTWSLQKDLNVIAQWSSRNNINLNPKKCKELVNIGTLSSFVEDENENEIMTWHALGHWDENIVFGAKIES